MRLEYQLLLKSPSQPYWPDAPLHAVMSLQFTHVHSFACRDRLPNLRTDSYYWSSLCNNNMATILLMLTSSYDIRRFTACDC